MEHQPSSPTPPNAEKLSFKQKAMFVTAGLVVGALAVYMVLASTTTMMAVTMPAANGDDCTMLPDFGHRPLCAKTKWKNSTHTCTITGTRADGCACYAGQTQSCAADGGALCSPQSAKCGVKWCEAQDDKHASWGSCSVP